MCTHAPIHRRRAAAALFALLMAGAGAPGRAAAGGGEAATAEAPEPPPRRSERLYEVPAVRLVRQDGRVVSLPEEVDDGRPVVLNFVFTTCTTICPLMSATFAGLERRLGAEAARAHLMSISIDPEQDTPARLTEYARRFHAGPEWQHYTGTLEASVATQKAFDVYRGGKMSHSLVTLLRAAPGRPWVRLDGWVTPDQVLQEYRALVAAPAGGIAPAATRTAAAP